jgi:hypothetical protein
MFFPMAHIPRSASAGKLHIYIIYRLTKYNYFSANNQKQTHPIPSI